MTTSELRRKSKVIDSATVLARWLLGATFLFMGLQKALHPVEFLKLVRQYEIVKSFLLLDLIAACLPWLEVFCGLLLLAGIAVRGTSLVLLMMLLPLTLIVLHRALNLQSALGVAFCAVKFDCGCGSGEVFICRKLFENFILIIISIWLLAGRGRILCVRYSL
jgi:uncharacterized membrane protein YphA (DoxX/SURF4 family)